MFVVRSLDDARAVSSYAWKLQHDEAMDASQMQRLAGRSALVSTDRTIHTNGTEPHHSYGVDTKRTAFGAP